MCGAFFVGLGIGEEGLELWVVLSKKYTMPVQI